MPFWRPTCLQQSLALWWLLRRQGIVAELQLGVKKNLTEFSSHAWVELGDCVVNDCERVTETYQKLRV
jgi:hypothetical protein